MDKITAIHPILKSVSELELLVQAVAFDIVREAGDYELLETLLGLARDIHTIGRRVESIIERPKGGRKETTRSKSEAPTPSKKRAKSRYPRFFVTDDRIIKIGKGKSRKAQEYRHEASRESFQKLLTWLDEMRSSGKREWLAQDAVDGLASDVPSYQIYLMLAALRASGMLVNVRRGAYEVGENNIATTDYWSMLRSKFGEDDVGAEL